MTAGSPIPGLLERRHPLARSPLRRVVMTRRIAGGLNHEQGPSWLVLGLVGWPLRRSTSIIVSAANAEIPYEGVLTPAGDSQPRRSGRGNLFNVASISPQRTSDTLRVMQPYLSSARRYRWWVVAILVVVWVTGLIAAYLEYKTTYESRATVWVLRASPELAASNPTDPSVPLVQTGASQQADLLNQLLQTRSFTEDVVGRTSLGPALQGASDRSAFLENVRKHFQVKTIGPNMLSLSFTGHDPRVAFELARSALDVRADRVGQARIEATAALTALYRREFQLAQAHALEAQRQLDQFTNANNGPLSELDQRQRDQLRLVLDLAQARVSDLQARMDRSVLAPALLDISGMEFQVVDPPREETQPSGGTRPALVLAAVAAGFRPALAALLLMCGAGRPRPPRRRAGLGRPRPALR